MGAMHLLNPILSRLDTHRWVDNPQGNGRYLDTFKQFVSCSCAWHEWVEGDTDDAQNAWIDHMADPDRWLGE